MPWDAYTSRFTSLIRLNHARGPGAQVGPRPEKPLVLYEFEGCPMCRRVREAISELSLPVQMRPCPKEGQRFRPDAQQRAGKMQFPFLEDPNTGVSMLESVDIVKYLYSTYGTGEAPAWLVGGPFALSSMLASLSRGGRGTYATPAPPIEVEVQLFGFEGDPTTRRVRERLCEYQIPYTWNPGAFAVHIQGQPLADPDSALAALDALARNQPA